MILLWLCRAINDFIEKAPLPRFGYFGKKYSTTKALSHQEIFK
jgi:hypothetical protein